MKRDWCSQILVQKVWIATKCDTVLVKYNIPIYIASGTLKTVIVLTMKFVIIWKNLCILLRNWIKYVYKLLLRREKCTFHCLCDACQYFVMLRQQYWDLLKKRLQLFDCKINEVYTYKMFVTNEISTNLLFVITRLQR